MGGKLSKFQISLEEAAALCSQETWQRYEALFDSVSLDGYADQHTFFQTFLHDFHFPPALTDRVFSVMGGETPNNNTTNTTQNGNLGPSPSHGSCISRTSFLITCALIFHGTLKQRLHFLFHLYDLDNSEKLTYKSLKSIVSMFHDVIPGRDSHTATVQLFQKMSTKGETFITFDEFLHWSYGNLDNFLLSWGLAISKESSEPELDEYDMKQIQLRKALSQGAGQDSKSNLEQPQMRSISLKGSSHKNVQEVFNSSEHTNQSQSQSQSFQRQHVRSTSISAAIATSRIVTIIPSSDDESDVDRLAKSPTSTVSQDHHLLSPPSVQIIRVNSASSSEAPLSLEQSPRETTTEKTREENFVDIFSRLSASHSLKAISTKQIKALTYTFERIFDAVHLKMLNAEAVGRTIQAISATQFFTASNLASPQHAVKGLLPEKLSVLRNTLARAGLATSDPIPNIVSIDEYTLRYIRNDLQPHTLHIADMVASFSGVANPVLVYSILRIALSYSQLITPAWTPSSSVTACLASASSRKTHPPSILLAAQSAAISTSGNATYNDPTNTYRLPESTLVLTKEEDYLSLAREEPYTLSTLEKIPAMSFGAPNVSSNGDQINTFPWSNSNIVTNFNQEFDKTYLHHHPPQKSSPTTPISLSGQASETPIAKHISHIASRLVAERSISEIPMISFVVGILKLTSGSAQEIGILLFNFFCLHSTLDDPFPNSVGIQRGQGITYSDFVLTLYHCLHPSGTDPEKSESFDSIESSCRAIFAKYARLADDQSATGSLPYSKKRSQDIFTKGYITLDSFLLWVSEDSLALQVYSLIKELCILLFNLTPADFAEERVVFLNTLSTLSTKNLRQMFVLKNKRSNDEEVVKIVKFDEDESDYAEDTFGSYETSYFKARDANRRLTESIVIGKRSLYERALQALDNELIHTKGIAPLNLALFKAPDAKPANSKDAKLESGLELFTLYRFLKSSTPSSKRSLLPNIVQSDILPFTCPSRLDTTSKHVGCSQLSSILQRHPRKLGFKVTQEFFNAESLYASDIQLQMAKLECKPNAEFKRQTTSITPNFINQSAISANNLLQAHRIQLFPQDFMKSIAKYLSIPLDHLTKLISSIFVNEAQSASKQSSFAFDLSALSNMTSLPTFTPFSHFVDDICSLVLKTAEKREKQPSTLSPDQSPLIVQVMVSNTTFTDFFHSHQGIRGNDKAKDTKDVLPGFYQLTASVTRRSKQPQHVVSTDFASMDHTLVSSSQSSEDHHIHIPTTNTSSETESSYGSEASLRLHGLDSDSSRAPSVSSDYISPTMPSNFSKSQTKAFLSNPGVSAAQNFTSKTIVSFLQSLGLSSSRSSAQQTYDGLSSPHEIFVLVDSSDSDAVDIPAGCIKLSDLQALASAHRQTLQPQFIDTTHLFNQSNPHSDIFCPSIRLDALTDPIPSSSFSILPQSASILLSQWYQTNFPIVRHIYSFSSTHPSLNVPILYRAVELAPLRLRIRLPVNSLTPSILKAALESPHTFELHSSRVIANLSTRKSRFCDFYITVPRYFSLKRVQVLLVLLCMKEGYSEYWEGCASSVFDALESQQKRWLPNLSSDAENGQKSIGYQVKSYKKLNSLNSEIVEDHTQYTMAPDILLRSNNSHKTEMLAYKSALHYNNNTSVLSPTSNLPEASPSSGSTSTKTPASTATPGSPATNFTSPADPSLVSENDFENESTSCRGGDEDVEAEKSSPVNVTDLAFQSNIMDKQSRKRINGHSQAIRNKNNPSSNQTQPQFQSTDFPDLNSIDPDDFPYGPYAILTPSTETQLNASDSTPNYLQIITEKNGAVSGIGLPTYARDELLVSLSSQVRFWHCRRVQVSPQEYFETQSTLHNFRYLPDSNTVCMNVPPHYVDESLPSFSALSSGASIASAVSSAFPVSEPPAPKLPPGPMKPVISKISITGASHPPTAQHPSSISSDPEHFAPLIRPVTGYFQDWYTCLGHLNSASTLLYMLETGDVENDIEITESEYRSVYFPTLPSSPISQSTRVMYAEYRTDDAIWPGIVTPTGSTIHFNELISIKFQDPACLSAPQNPSKSSSASTLIANTNEEATLMRSSLFLEAVKQTSEVISTAYPDIHKQDGNGLVEKQSSRAEHPARSMPSFVLERTPEARERVVRAMAERKRLNEAAKTQKVLLPDSTQPPEDPDMFRDSIIDLKSLDMFRTSILGPNSGFFDANVSERDLDPSTSKTTDSDSVISSKSQVGYTPQNTIFAPRSIGRAIVTKSDVSASFIVPESTEFGKKSKIKRKGLLRPHPTKTFTPTFSKLVQQYALVSPLLEKGNRLGIHNTGNSCYMNSAIQALSHITPLAYYFLSKKFENEVNLTNPLGMKGDVVRGFATVVQKLWNMNPSEISSLVDPLTLTNIKLPKVAQSTGNQDKSVAKPAKEKDAGIFSFFKKKSKTQDEPVKSQASVQPTPATGSQTKQKLDDTIAPATQFRNSVLVPSLFRTIVANHSRQFRGLDQQDSQEFLSFLIDGVHEGLNRVMNKPTYVNPDSDGVPDNDVAKIQWDNYKSRNDSIIVDLMAGQMKNTLRRHCCNHTSINFDPYMTLSIPIPDSTHHDLREAWNVDLRVIACRADLSSRLTRLSVSFDSYKSSVADIKVELGVALNIHPARLLLCLVRAGAIEKVFLNDQRAREVVHASPESINRGHCSCVCANTRVRAGLAEEVKNAASSKNAKTQDGAPKKFSKTKVMGGSRDALQMCFCSECLANPLIHPISPSNMAISFNYPRKTAPNTDKPWNISSFNVPPVVPLPALVGSPAECNNHFNPLPSKSNTQNDLNRQNMAPTALYQLENDKDSQFFDNAQMNDYLANMQIKEFPGAVIYCFELSPWEFASQDSIQVEATVCRSFEDTTTSHLLSVQDAANIQSAPIGSPIITSRLLSDVSLTGSSLRSVPDIANHLASHKPKATSTAEFSTPIKLSSRLESSARRPDIQPGFSRSGSFLNSSFNSQLNTASNSPDSSAFSSLASTPMYYPTSSLDNLPDFEALSTLSDDSFFSNVSPRQRSATAVVVSTHSGDHFSPTHLLPLNEVPEQDSNSSPNDHSISQPLQTTPISNDRRGQLRGARRLSTVGFSAISNNSRSARLMSERFSDDALDAQLEASSNETDPPPTSYQHQQGDEQDSQDEDYDQFHMYSGASHFSGLQKSDGLNGLDSTQFVVEQDPTGLGLVPTSFENENAVAKFDPEQRLPGGMLKIEFDDSGSIVVGQQAIANASNLKRNNSVRGSSKHSKKQAKEPKDSKKDSRDSKDSKSDLKHTEKAISESQKTKLQSSRKQSTKVTDAEAIASFEIIPSQKSTLSTTAQGSQASKSSQTSQHSNTKTITSSTQTSPTNTIHAGHGKSFFQQSEWYYDVAINFSSQRVIFFHHRYLQPRELYIVKSSLPTLFATPVSLVVSSTVRAIELYAKIWEYIRPGLLPDSTTSQTIHNLGLEYFGFQPTTFEDTYASEKDEQQTEPMSPSLATQTLSAPRKRSVSATSTLSAFSAIVFPDKFDDDVNESSNEAYFPAFENLADCNAAKRALRENIFSRDSRFVSQLRSVATYLCTYPRPFTLRRTSARGDKCDICPWSKFCSGCEIPLFVQDTQHSSDNAESQLSLNNMKFNMDTFLDPSNKTPVYSYNYGTTKATMFGVDLDLSSLKLSKASSVVIEWNPEFLKQSIKASLQAREHISLAKASNDPPTLQTKPISLPYLLQFDTIFRPTDDLSLVRPTDKCVHHNALDIYSCIEGFSITDQLRDMNQIYCRPCQQHTDATKRLEIWSIPKVLTIHIRRLTQGRKRNETVRFPIRGLTFDPYLSTGSWPSHNPLTETEIQNRHQRGFGRIWDLVSVIYHVGNEVAGHYTCAAKDFVSNTWRMYDDHKVYSIPESSLISSSAYVLIYQERE